MVSGPQAVQPTGQPPAAGSGRVAVGGLNELEVDLPLLMDAEDTEDPPEAQQGQVGVRAEPPVPQADVAGLKRGMQLHDLDMSWVRSGEVRISRSKPVPA